MVTTSPTDKDYVDVLIVGAGLSGIGSARHLQRECPERSFRPAGVAGGARRHLGFVPLSRHTLRQ